MEIKEVPCCVCNVTPVPVVGSASVGVCSSCVSSGKFVSKENTVVSDTKKSSKPVDRPLKKRGRKRSTLSLVIESAIEEGKTVDEICSLLARQFLRTDYKRNRNFVNVQRNRMKKRDTSAS